MAWFGVPASSTHNGHIGRDTFGKIEGIICAISTILMSISTKSANFFPILLMYSRPRRDTMKVSETSSRLDRIIASRYEINIWESRMVERQYVSTAQVAAALGVSVTTVKRWVDEGILPAQRTPGKHRKLPLDEVLRTVREGNFPRADLARLNVTLGHTARPEPRLLVDRFLETLKGRDVGGARRLLQEAHAGGLSVVAIADEVVAPVMARLGHEWEKGKIDVGREHRGTQVCMAALFALKSQLENDTPGRPLAIGGGPENDPYLLANVLAEMVLLEAGWEVANLGPNTPLAALGKALAELRPRLLWLSISYLKDAAAFARDYRALYEEAVRAGVAVAIGGRALTDRRRVDLPYTTYGDRLGHLAAFARTVHTRPRRRPRGRPRRT